MLDLPSNMFRGKPCHKCGSDLRYRTSKPGGRCVDCARQSERERMKQYRESAKNTDQTTFEGKPCKKCSRTIRHMVTRKCVACLKDAASRSRIKNKEKYAERYKGKYKDKLYSKSAVRQSLGICDDAMNNLLASQNGVCAICKNSEKDGKALSVDHCHETGVFRGLLCRKCNTGLGFFSDNIETLRAAIDYLENNRWIV